MTATSAALDLPPPDLQAALPAGLEAWLDEHADSLDADDRHALEVIPRLAEAGLLASAVPACFGGDDEPPSRAIAAIAAVAEHSVAAAFAFWGQRVYIEFLVRGESPALRDRHLPALLEGRLAGASGLSNAMKFLSGIEGVGLTARDGMVSGRVPWITNVRRGGFLAAAAAGTDDGGLLILSLPHDRPGLVRSDDLDLIALRGTQTAALTIEDLSYGQDDVIARDGRRWLPRVRPAFLGFQCGLSVGLARAALAMANRLARDARSVLGPALDRAGDELAGFEQALAEGVDDGRFVESPAALFELRIGLARLVREAVDLELLASGGRAYSRNGGLGFARRWREAAFIPIVTPSLTQLEGELLRQQGRR